MMLKTNKKGTIKFTRLYFITTNNNDLDTLNKYFEINSRSLLKA